MNYKVYWITLCRNEEDIIPFCIPYWQRIADKVIVYDNHSDDSSLELLSKYDWIEIRTFDSGGKMNDTIQKEVKEKAYLEFKDQCDIMIITDMDEVFYFNDFKAVCDVVINNDYNVVATPIYSLCDDYKPFYDHSKLLHEQCHKFYKQRMNHMKGLDDYSKLSIFNTKITHKITMSVGQHYVTTHPLMKKLLYDDGFSLHIDKGLFGREYYISKKKKMGQNLSETNIRGGMGFEYLKSEEELGKIYDENQKNSFDLNKKL